jgi:hypothetical protein
MDTHTAVAYAAYQKYKAESGDNTPIRVDNRQIGLVRQRYVKFSIGLTLFGEDSWFVRYKYD